MKFVPVTQPMHELAICPLAKEDLVQIAELHISVFPESLLSAFGLNVVRRYYKWQLEGPHKCFAVGAYDQEALVGFSFGGYFQESMVGFIRENKTHIIFQLLTHPRLTVDPHFLKMAWTILILTLKKHFTNYSRQIKVNTQRSKSFGILSVAVHNRYRGKGVGKRLMEFSELIAIQNGFLRMHLTVHPSNSNAITFYEKLGFERWPENGSWTGSMRKMLKTDPELGAL